MSIKIREYLEKSQIKIKDKIGCGGYGEIYIVEIKKHEGVIKIVETKTKKYSKGEIKKIKEQIEIIQNIVITLCHKNIVKTIYKDLKEFPEELISITLMERCEYKDLNNFINLLLYGKIFGAINFTKDFYWLTTISENSLCFFVNQIINGLLYLHQSCLVHRDIKLENILIHKDFVVKICDFDTLFRVTIDNLKNKDSKTTLKETTLICSGPEYYINNGLININEHIFKIDIFSLGTLMYYIMFKEHLIHKINKLKEDYDEKIFEFIQNGIDKIKNSKFSEGLKNFIIKLLTSDINKRPNTFEIANDKWISDLYKYNKYIYDIFYIDIKKLFIEYQKANYFKRKFIDNYKRKCFNLKKDKLINKYKVIINHYC